MSHLKAASRRAGCPMPTCSWGPRGWARPATARALAAALNCTSPGRTATPAGSAPPAAAWPAGTHPDFLVIGPPEGRKPQIKIEQIRELRRLTAYPPLGGGWRVVLIKPAEALTAATAANALLKTLEEPPPQHLLVLTARGGGRPFAHHRVPVPQAGLCAPALAPDHPGTGEPGPQPRPRRRCWPP